MAGRIFRTRRESAWRVGYFCVVLLGSWPRPLLAAPTEPNSPVDQAAEVEDLITRGIALRRAGDDAHALALFQRADELQPRSTRIRVHLAAACQALGRWEEADRYLALALEDPADPYVQKHQAILAAARHTIDGHMASVELTGDPPGAQLWLNGRALGTLPLTQLLRVEAGIYTLEARLRGHYPVTRSLALPGGVLTREQISLAPVTSADVPPASPHAAAPSSSLQWLPWTFAGLAAGAGVGTALAWAARERHVERWNDDSACLPPNGKTRGESCAAEHDAGDRAESWMWVGAATAGAFAVASLVSFWLVGSAGPEQEQPSVGALQCGLGGALVQCAGRF
jgi:hypothetical protein